MKPQYLAILVVLFLACYACREEPRTDRDDVATNWSDDGKTLRVTRKGATIVEITNISNAFSVTAYGTDRVEDFSAHYTEDDKGDAPTPETMTRSSLKDDGNVAITFYDSAGTIVGEETLPYPKEKDAQQGEDAEAGDPPE